jgi:hypothetical protein
VRERDCTFANEVAMEAAPIILNKVSTETRIMEEYKELPYGIADFKKLIQQGYYYVDKTPFIKEMRRSPFLILLRPRRFGKSLFLSMLSCYYDINERDNFDSLFKGTWIAENPTPEQGTYQVLSMDFSMLNNTTDNLPEKLNDYCCAKVDDFIDSYKEYYPEHVFNAVFNSTTFEGKINRINNHAKRKGYFLCLILDEYDNFTNSILASKGHNVYQAITHADGYYRELFKIFKGTFDRIVMTGVSPVTFNDLTSGFNIASDVTMYPEYNAALGFSTKEVQQMLQYYREKGLLPTDTSAILKEMKEWYDGYCFSKKSLDSEEWIFNSTMVINYLRYYIRHNCPPENLIDKNTRTDYAKLQQLLKLDHLNGNRKKTLVQIVQDGYTTGEVTDSFPAEKLTNPDIFKSLLFYYGMLSFRKDPSYGTVLGIPNKNVRILFYDYLTEEYNKILPLETDALEMHYKEAAIDGKWRDMIEYLCEKLHKSSSIRCLIEGERNAQGYLLACLNLSAYYQTDPEVEVNHGYCDFFLMPNFTVTPNIKHSYIIELKYLTATDSETKAEAQWQEAVAQINQYVQAPKVHLLCRGTILHGIVLQIKGSELYRTEEIKCLDFTNE